MSINEKQYLHEMGITSWELIHPERLAGYQPPTIDLPSSCKLLLVSPICPTNETAILFEKILKSMKLTLEQAMHIEPERLAMLGEHQLEWVWFAGCESNSMENAKQLTSPLLQDIDGNNEQKRALWLQICSYS
ncbi:TPA: DNA polymerase III subunit psi [Vibrio parahaemolyticus]|uniref:DNA polymerase III subunit psi n=1 Tax=Vibrio TaxID=662 RepID=UPI000413A1A5|nr:MULTISPECIES: DNA polymerase III subunit psi [Vibrio]EGQ7674887.1 DNA polymerase III subunit psi [Vibrio parahaemolyticus]EGQ8273009.1 DNA polymerase III subunit psi [Vibrio parahaemolyticus]EGQ8519015.1 DNA polymerase III subunit psi [Vibrio parahaemolyticus]EGQ8940096.1 DNA polymerase III subunit psi [Vibrio parahaemolyticus]EGQ8950627.1 DNA polymerase III subunit psi [Vibrio parahaemolyticus]